MRAPRSFRRRHRGGPDAQRCTTGQVTVRVMPCTEWIRKGPARREISVRTPDGTNRVVGQRPDAVDLLDHRAAEQHLRDGTGLGTSPFQPLTLEPGEPKTECYFSLSPSTSDEPLAVRSGDRVEFRLRVGRNGRDRRVAIHGRIGPVTSACRGACSIRPYDCQVGRAIPVRFR
jgi:hypothetical protein